MSGILSGVTKIFTSVGSAAAKIPSSIAGIGASAFTAGAATAAPSIASGGLSNLFGNGVLGNMFSGAVSKAIPGAIIGGLGSAITGGSVLQGAAMGGGVGALGGGIGGLFNPVGNGATGAVNDPTGSQYGVDNMTTGSVQKPFAVTGTAQGGGGLLSGANGQQQVNTGLTSTSQASPTGQGLFDKISNFATSEKGGALIAGLGNGLSEYMKAKDIAEENDKVRQFKLDEQNRITNSFKVNPGNNAAVESAATEFKKPRYQYDPSVGRIVLA